MLSTSSVAGDHVRRARSAVRQVKLVLLLAQHEAALARVLEQSVPGVPPPRSGMVRGEPLIMERSESAKTNVCLLLKG